MNELSKLHAERKSLRDELIHTIEAIKLCKDKEERAELFKLKKEIYEDIEDVDFDIKELATTESEDNSEVDEREIVDDTKEE